MAFYPSIRILSKVRSFKMLAGYRQWSLGKQWEPYTTPQACPEHIGILPICVPSINMWFQEGQELGCLTRTANHIPGPWLVIVFPKWSNTRVGLWSMSYVISLMATSKSPSSQSHHLPCTYTVVSLPPGTHTHTHTLRKSSTFSDRLIAFILIFSNYFAWIVFLKLSISLL